MSRAPLFRGAVPSSVSLEVEPGGGGRSSIFPEISFSSCLRHTHAVLRSIRSCLRSPRTGQAAVCGQEPLVAGSAGSLACLPRGRVDQMGPGLDVGGVTWVWTQTPPTPSSLYVQPRATHPSPLSSVSSHHKCRRWFRRPGILCGGGEVLAAVSAQRGCCVTAHLFPHFPNFLSDSLEPWIPH